jgi:hypothetical protein
MTKIRSPRIVSGTSGSKIVELLNEAEIEFKLRAIQSYKPPYFIDTSLEAIMCPRGLRTLLGEPDLLNINSRQSGLLTFFAFYDDKNHAIIGNYNRREGLLIERTRIYTLHS